ncbi:MAG: hypothetical protein FJ319_01235 [SAR202 cluster bacterium]|nr:hypothetical protein [SAR202 cluster bacterium]
MPDRRNAAYLDARRRPRAVAVARRRPRTAGWVLAFGFALGLYVALTSALADAASVEHRRVVFVDGMCSEAATPGDFTGGMIDGAVGPYEPSFAQVRRWLIEERGYRDLPDRVDGAPQVGDDIVYFSYASDRQKKYPYTYLDTLISIDGDDFTFNPPGSPQTASAPRSSGLMLREYIRSLTANGETVDLVGFSQGGVVSLWAALDDDISRRVNSITTIESPVRGTSNMAAQLAGTYTCSSNYSQAVLDMGASRPLLGITSAMVQGILDQDWNEPGRPRVVNVSSVSDPIVAGSIFATGGERGLLDAGKVHRLCHIDAGGTVYESHSAPLRVYTNPVAMVSTREAILAATCGEGDEKAEEPVAQPSVPVVVTPPPPPQPIVAVGPLQAALSWLLRLLGR